MACEGGKRPRDLAQALARGGGRIVSSASPTRWKPSCCGWNVCIPMRRGPRERPRRSRRLTPRGSPGRPSASAAGRPWRSAGAPLAPSCHICVPPWGCSASRGTASLCAEVATRAEPPGIAPSSVCQHPARAAVTGTGIVARLGAPVGPRWADRAPPRGRMCRTPSCVAAPCSSLRAPCLPLARRRHSWRRAPWRPVHAHAWAPSAARAGAGGPSSAPTARAPAVSPRGGPLGPVR